MSENQQRLIGADFSAARHNGNSVFFCGNSCFDAKLN